MKPTPQIVFPIAISIYFDILFTHSCQLIKSTYNSPPTLSVTRLIWLVQCGMPYECSVDSRRISAACLGELYAFIALTAT